MTQPLPSGTITFLFTDIEGSTKLLQAMPERYPKVLREHHGILRKVFGENGGAEVGTEGDAFFVAFAQTDDAVSAAVAAQRALDQHEWGFEGGLKVRMGLHTGRGEPVGDNYGGLDVHRAARISSAAHGGQVLLSETTRALVEGSLPDGTRLKKLGRFQLKDIENLEDLFQLCIDGLRTDFPAPRTPDSRPHNLPARLNRFVERERELTDLLALLPRARLITLTGPGGTGKTRLALEVAYEKLLTFADGTFVVFLAPLSEAQLVPSAVADALGLVEQGLKPIEASIKEFLADKELLLVLDNFEQVTEAAPFVGELLAGAPGIRIVVTTRVALRISGEQEYPVPPMVVPDPERLPSIEQMTAYASVELFLERARAVKPDFALTAENAETIARICRQLDGLPLAIELAAARIRLLSVDDILRRLEGGLQILAGGARDLPSRQQTLENAIAWSYDLLDDATATFFRRLGVFSGGWTLAAAEAVCNPRGEIGIDSFDALEGLVDNNLVRSLEDHSGETRFRMLQTIREFSATSLGTGDEAELARDRHAAYFCKMAQDLSGSLTREGDAPDRLSSDHDNLRAALRHLIDRGRGPDALAMGAALWRYWQIRGHLAEGREWLEEILGLSSAGARDTARVRGLIALGSITYWQNDWPPTRRAYEEALAISRELGDSPAVAEAAYNAGFLGLLEDDVDSAENLFREALEIYEELDDRSGQANASWGLAMAATGAGEFEEALVLADRALRLFTELDDWFGKMLGAFVPMQVARLSGDLALAERRALDQLDETKKTEDLAAIASLLDVLADIWIAQGKVERGLRVAGATEAMRTTFGGGAPPPLIRIEDPRAAAAGSLTSDEIEAALAEGMAMSVEDTIAYVQKDGD